MNLTIFTSTVTFILIWISSLPNVDSLSIRDPTYKQNRGISTNKIELATTESPPQAILSTKSWFSDLLLRKILSCFLTHPHSHLRDIKPLNKPLNKPNILLNFSRPNREDLTTRNRSIRNSKQSQNSNFTPISQNYDRLLSNSETIKLKAKSPSWRMLSTKFRPISNSAVSKSHPIRTTVATKAIRTTKNSTVTTSVHKERPISTFNPKNPLSSDRTTNGKRSTTQKIITLSSNQVTSQKSQVTQKTIVSKVTSVFHKQYTSTKISTSSSENQVGTTKNIKNDKRVEVENKFIIIGIVLIITLIMCTSIIAIILTRKHRHNKKMKNVKNPGTISDYKTTKTEHQSSSDSGSKKSSKKANKHKIPLFKVRVKKTKPQSNKGSVPGQKSGTRTTNSGSHPSNLKQKDIKKLKAAHHERPRTSRVVTPSPMVKFPIEQKQKSS